MQLEFKDAGFVHESFRNETNRVIGNFWSYKTNPRNESFEHRSTKRIHETNLLSTLGGLVSRIRIGTPRVIINWLRIHVFTNLLYDSRILKLDAIY